jgi:signal transduction histidine kinase
MVRILLVERDPEVVEGVQREVAPGREGWIWTVASTPAQALEQLAGSTVDVLVLDANFCAEELVAPLRALTRSTVVLSGGRGPPGPVDAIPAAGDRLATMTELPRVLEETVDGLARSASTSLAALERVFAGSNEGVAVLDNELRYVTANPAFLKILEPDCGTVIGRDGAGFFEEAFYRDQLVPLIRACLQGRPGQWEGWLEQPNLGRRFLEIRLQPAAEGVAPGLALQFIRDLTEWVEMRDSQRQLSERLNASQTMEAVGSFAADVAHDFNNMLTAILGYTEMVSLLVQDRPDALRILQEMEQAAEQTAGVTKALLSFSRLSKSEKNAVSLPSLVKQASRMLRRVLPQSIEVSADPLPNEEWWVHGDLAQLQLMLLNLGVHAREGLPKGGKLRLSLHRLDLAETSEAWRVEHEGETPVAIRLQEIPPEGDFAGHPGEGGAKGGLGSGIAVVRGIVREHQGEIAPRPSRIPGRCVQVILPLHRKTVPGAETSPSRDRGRGERLLLVEENRQFRAIIASTMRRAGYHVQQASDGVEALEIFQRDQARLSMVILSDDLPRKSSLQCLQRMRAMRPNFPAILLSGRHQQITPKGLREGIFVLNKPFAMSSLTALVVKALDEALAEG